MAKSETSASGYRIGTVSRLTGISPDTLRIWERRYRVVTPERTTAGGRLYTRDDIVRLKLIGRLVDKGDAIGVIAGLSPDQLQERLTETQSAATTVTAETPCRLVVIGELLSVKIKAAADALTSINLLACYDNSQAFLADANSIDADILLIEQPTLQAETAVQVVDWIARVNAARAIVVYHFAAKEALQRLPRSKCSTLRAPVDAATVQNHCMAIMDQYNKPEPDETGYLIIPGESAPPRRYSDEDLARLAALSSTIKCECPRHLAELITSLSAFEQYSSECESRNLKDAELHAYLCATAAQGRHMFEKALGHVIEAENIDL